MCVKLTGLSTAGRDLSAHSILKWRHAWVGWRPAIINFNHHCLRPLSALSLGRKADCKAEERHAGFFLG